MSGMRIRWETAAKLIAGAAAALVIVGLAPSLLSPREPEPLPDDVGLAPPPTPPPIDARAAAGERALAAARRRRARRQRAQRGRAQRRRSRLEARRSAERRRQLRRHRGRAQPVSSGRQSGPVAISPSSPPPPPSAADEFGFER